MKTNKEIDRIIKVFNKQISREYKQYGIYKECPSYWHKLLFIETIDFTINDWRKIRTKEYWSICDNLKVAWYEENIISIEQEKFILQRVREYKRKYK